MSKKIVAAVSAASVLFTALPAFAQTQTTTRTPGAAFCTNISQLETSITTRLDERGKKIGDHRTNFVDKKDARWAAHDDKLEQARQSAEDKRKANYDKMMAKATTQTQIDAVNAFKATVDAAVLTRNGAVDAAVDTYRAGIDQALSDHANALSQLQATFKADVLAAVDKAEQACGAAGADGAAIRDQLKADISAAQTKFKTDRSALTTLEGKRQELGTARKASIDAAQKAFRDTVKAAAETLKLAFPTT